MIVSGNNTVDAFLEDCMKMEKRCYVYGRLAGATKYRS